MNKQQNTYFLITLAAIFIAIFVLLLLFVPDMGATLINPVPEFPPEIGEPAPGVSEPVNKIDISKENVKSVVAALARPSEYYTETQSILSYTGGSATYNRRKWVKNGRTRIDVMNNYGTAVSHAIYAGGNVFLWRPGDRTYYKTAEGSISPDDLQMMMTYEDILKASDESILTAQYTQYDGINCIYAEVSDPKLLYTERYWVSVSTGLLVYGQTLNESGSVIYSITALRTDISPQNDEIFELPDGTNALTV